MAAEYVLHRDKVYGMVGLLGVDFASWIAVGYSQAPGDIYANFVKSMLDCVDCVGSLRLLEGVSFADRQDGINSCYQIST